MDNEKEDLVLSGIITLDNEDYSIMATLLGVQEFNQNRLIGIILENIPDDVFNKLLTGDHNVKVKLRGESSTVLKGKIMGGSDPTRLIKKEGTQINPKQRLKILLEKSVDDEASKHIDGQEAEIYILCV